MAQQPFFSTMMSLWRRHVENENSREAIKQQAISEVALDMGQQWEVSKIMIFTPFFLSLSLNYPHRKTILVIFKMSLKHKYDLMLPFKTVFPSHFCQIRSHKLLPSERKRTFSFFWMMKCKRVNFSCHSVFRKRKRGIVCILQYLKVPQDFQQLHSLETAQIGVLNDELCRKTKAGKMVIVVFFLLGVATQPPL